MEGTIRRVAAHYGKKMTNEQVKQLSEHLDIKKFKNNPSVNLEPIVIAKTKTPKSDFVREGKNIFVLFCYFLYPTDVYMYIMVIILYCY
jgi:hypothetical protein